MIKFINKIHWFIWLLIILVIYFIAGTQIFKWYCLKHYPVKMQYPKIPVWTEGIIRGIDHLTRATANIIWNIQKDKKGIEYIINREGFEIWIKPYHRKGKWIKISQKEYKIMFEENWGNKGILKKGYMKSNDLN